MGKCLRHMDVCIRTCNYILCKLVAAGIVHSTIIHTSKVDNLAF